MLPVAIGQNEILIIVLVILLLFGVRKLPEIGRSLAEGIHEFKKASRKAREEEEAEESASSKGSQTAD